MAVDPTPSDLESAASHRLAIPQAPRVLRFGLTERRLHTVHGTAFAVLLATGFVLYLPFMAQIVSDRPLMKAIHLAAAALWLTALVLVVVLGDRTALRATRREIERLDADDLRFLRTRGRSQTAGRFNGGQKAHAIVQAGLAISSRSPGRCSGSASATRPCACRARSRCTTRRRCCWRCSSSGTSCRPRRTRTRWRASGAAP
jgi:hypothetical protein